MHIYCCADSDTAEFTEGWYHIFSTQTKLYALILNIITNLSVAYLAISWNIHRITVRKANFGANFLRFWQNQASLSWEAPASLANVSSGNLRVITEMATRCRSKPHCSHCCIPLFGLCQTGLPGQAQSADQKVAGFPGLWLAECREGEEHSSLAPCYHFPSTNGINRAAQRKASGPVPHQKKKKEKGTERRQCFSSAMHFFSGKYFICEASLIHLPPPFTLMWDCLPARSLSAFHGGTEHWKKKTKKKKTFPWWCLNPQLKSASEPYRLSAVQFHATM